MTEAEWLICSDTYTDSMLAFARDASERKTRLFTCACVRAGWRQLVDERSRFAVEQAERFADQLIDELELDRAGSAAQLASEELDRAAPHPVDVAALGTLAPQKRCAAAILACTTARPESHFFRGGGPSGYVSDIATIASRFTNVTCLLRDIFGNPFRPVTFSPSWRTSTTLALAAQMYESRDFGAMPILADALQDAGCDSADILNHCRGEGPHVRGCWVVDLVLGKE
ncbi:hypothetical protein [Gemmata palustris]|uniref:hypothetical protein n=1 Tax=Gemmata palustris TaxID=2822762 RepID=UPI001FECEDF9|nr:hypothetical protein [Gemmata palustris]